MESNQMQGYQEAYRLACSRLKEMDPVDTANNAGCTYDASANVIQLCYLAKDYYVGYPDFHIARVSDGIQPSLPVQVLMLHYLLHAVKRPLSGRLISFREVRGGGANYYPSFEKRAVKPLLKAFEQRPEALLKAGLGLGGVQETYGDASVTVDILPLLPITYVLYLGDEEMPGSAAVLFDDTVNTLLPCEDVVLAASFGAYELAKLGE